jgi:hypothetical protein
MSTYQELKGLKVKYLSADTSGDRVKEGEIFYNSSGFTMGVHVATASWSSTTDALYPSYNTTGFGAQTASAFVGGSYPGYQNKTQEYNGLGFSIGGNYPESRGSIGTAGILTAGLAWGGNDSSEFESQLTNEYNGTAWTNVNNYPITVAAPAGAGTQTAGLGAGGWDYSGPFSVANTTNEYDGTNWTGGGNLNTARSSFWGGGTQTAAIMAGGDKFTPGTASNYGAETEEYNGSSWTSVNSLPGTTNGQGGRTTNGVQTDFRVFSSSQGTGFSSPYVKNYHYDGTNWTAAPNFTTARYGVAGSGTGPAAIITGGRSPSYVLTSEELNVSVNTITAAAWASGGNLNAAKDEGASSQNGLQTAALYFGGYSGTAVLGTNEEYNGTSWSEEDDLGTSRFSLGGAGTTAAALAYGGAASGGGTVYNNSEEYNGSSWSEGDNLGTARWILGGCGTQTAAIGYGGAPGQKNETEEYDGTSWSEQSNLSTARASLCGGIGIQTAAIAVGGQTPSYTTATEEYDGSSWTAGGTLNTVRSIGAGMGTATDGMVAGGSVGPGTPNYSALSEGYDGTSWSTRASLAQSRIHISGTGTATAGIAFGGNKHPAPTTATEEFTGETLAASAKTIDFD